MSLSSGDDGGRGDGGGDIDEQPRLQKKPSLEHPSVSRAIQQQLHEDQTDKRPLVHHSLYKPPPYRLVRSHEFII